MQFKSYYTLLIVGITAYILASLCVIYEVTPFIITELELNIMLATTAITHLLFYNLNSWNKYLFNVHRLFSRVIIFGITVILISAVVAWADVEVLLPPAGVRLVKMLLLYGVMSYFLYTLTMLRKLMFVRRNIRAERQWQVFFMVLLCSALAGLPWNVFPGFLRFAVYMTAFLASLSLLNRIKWVAELTRRDKWVIVFYLLIVNLIHLAAFQIVYNTQGLEYVINMPLYHNLFGTVLIGTVSAYCLFSLLALLFTLPVSSVIEEQMAEINRFQEIGLALQRRESTLDMYHRLFEVCLKNTSANAGWLLMHPLKSEETCHFVDISSEQIGRINVWISFKDLVKTEPVKGYSYHPNLDKYQIFAEDESPYKSLLILPIYTKPNYCEGAICLTKGFSEGFDEHMIKGCLSFINQAKLALENAELTKESIRSARYKEELDIATKVQQALLPQTFPESEFLEIATFNEPAKEIGGDYYDYAQANDRHISVIMADVSGKGASAAFHMAQMKGIFQSLIQLNLSASDFMIMANRSVSRCLEKNQFISAAYIYMNFETNQLTYARAGHNPILYYRANDKEANYIEGEGLGLGIIRNRSYAKFIGVTNLRLQQDDVIVLYTDGLVEGRKNESAEEQYGYENLKNCVVQHAHLNAQEITQAIYQDFAQFTVNGDFKDDTSIMVIKIKQLTNSWEPTAYEEYRDELPRARFFPETDDHRTF